MALAEEIIPNTIFFTNNLFQPDIDQLQDGRLIFTWQDYLGADIYQTTLDKPPAAEFGSVGVILGNSGNDTINGTFFDTEGDAVSTDDDFVLAGAGDDTVNPIDGDDVIYGGSGNNLLLGGAGNDFLSGDDGVDTLTGDGGADVFVFKPDTEPDTITDFKAI